eukprot:8547305-Karenia_brevis.AAC.1
MHWALFSPTAAVAHYLMPLRPRPQLQHLAEHAAYMLELFVVIDPLPFDIWRNLRMEHLRIDGGSVSSIVAPNVSQLELAHVIPRSAMRFHLDILNYKV